MSNIIVATNVVGQVAKEALVCVSNIVQYKQQRVQVEAQLEALRICTQRAQVELQTWVKAQNKALNCQKKGYDKQMKQFKKEAEEIYQKVDELHTSRMTILNEVIHSKTAAQQNQLMQMYQMISQTLESYDRSLADIRHHRVQTFYKFSRHVSQMSGHAYSHANHASGEVVDGEYDEVVPKKNLR